MLLTLAVGIPVDASGASWAQPLVSFWTWAVLGWIAAAAPAAERRVLAVCVVLATAGELFLKDVWGLYEYRLHNLPLFIPAGHALVYAAASRMATRAPMALPALVAGGFAVYAAVPPGTAGTRSASHGSWRSSRISPSAATAGCAPPSSCSPWRSSSTALAWGAGATTRSSRRSA